jgi:hypothetical protein
MKLRAHADIEAYTYIQIHLRILTCACVRAIHLMESMHTETCTVHQESETKEAVNPINSYLTMTCELQKLYGITAIYFLDLSIVSLFFNHNVSRDGSSLVFR